MNSIFIFISGIMFLVIANYFITLWIFDKKEKQMLDNLIKYLENEEKRKEVKD